MRSFAAYHASRGEKHRKVCLIPESAHGTNPATAAMAGLTINYIKTTNTGAVDLQSLKKACEKFKDRLSCIMITYPSTCGVFDDDIIEICDMVHHYGGQVFLDGANFNAQVRLPHSNLRVFTFNILLHFSLEFVDQLTWDQMLPI